MSTMDFFKKFGIFSVCLSLVFFAPIAQIFAANAFGAPANGTRAGEIGWQYDTWGENLVLAYVPEAPTTMDRITVTIRSVHPEVYIRQARLDVVVHPNEGPSFPYQGAFIRINDTAMYCDVEPFPLNGYSMSFRVLAYDYFSAEIISGSYDFNVTGSGWKHTAFLDNVVLSYSPLAVNATDKVTIAVVSKENVSFGGGNLYITYTELGGTEKTGGWNFTKLNQNATEMSQSIPEYPAGTNVTFWVTVWDIYGTAMTSQMYNYSVVGVVEYTDFPFEYVNPDDMGNYDRSKWEPDAGILLPMVTVCAIGIPLFLYIRVHSMRREEKEGKLVAKGGGDKDAGN